MWEQAQGIRDLQEEKFPLALADDHVELARKKLGPREIFRITP